MSSKCELCGAVATHIDSVPDPTKQGANLNECGYRTQWLCLAHANERREVATSRLQKICENCGGTMVIESPAEQFLHDELHAKRPGDNWGDNGLNRLPFSLFGRIAQLMTDFAAQTEKSHA